MKYVIRAITFLLLTAMSCKKDKLSELEKLPPITQTGAGTFGRLINGKAYTPKGFRFKPNFYMIVDPGYFENLDIRTYRYENDKSERLTIFCYDVLPTPQTYIINNINRIWLIYENESNGCLFLQDSSNYVSGILKISKYNLQSGIIAGEFECKLFHASTSCDTIRITNGRFDYKL